MLHHGEIEEDVNHRIKARWMKGRITSKVLCFFMLTSRALYDHRIPIKFKGTFYKNSACPILLYGIECWAIISRSDMFIK